MKVNAIKCKHCKDIIYSRCRHDMLYCSCNRIAIDGGFDYVRVYGNSKDMEHMELKINTTKKELYKDWVYNIDNFGRIVEWKK